MNPQIESFKLFGLPVFEFDINNISQVSLVNDPAVSDLFIKFNNEIIEEDVFKFSQPDETKRIVYGASMIGNFPMKRNPNERIPFPHVTYYTPEKVEQQAHLFMMNNMGSSTNINHSDEKNTAGAVLVESFVTRHELTHMGKVYKPHTWVTGFKITNDETWNEYVQTGKVKGFSIEASGDFIPVHFSNEINPLDQITALLKKEGYLS